MTTQLIYLNDFRSLTNDAIVLGCIHWDESEDPDWLTMQSRYVASNIFPLMFHEWVATRWRASRHNHWFYLLAFFLWEHETPSIAPNLNHPLLVWPQSLMPPFALTLNIYSGYGVVALLICHSYSYKSSHAARHALP